VAQRDRVKHESAQRGQQRQTASYIEHKTIELYFTNR